MVDTAVRLTGRLDVVVANAGVIPLVDVTEATERDWDDVMAVDGKGMFLTCKYPIEHMRDHGGGAIVCVMSISGVAGQARQATYGPAKFVASGLTMHLAGRTTSPASREPIRSDGWASRARWRPRSPSWPRTRHRSSPARSCRWTAATWPSDRAGALAFSRPGGFR
jgi:NAD(P)-dependent dehydrogenase (short-subunit alcohol dehydrogenase family)